uniref:Uncharacterized protein n=1 Tax=Cacopsylla melanoneura TaxID=428564 RepID=A0A8D8QVT5_9HEMI
MDAIFRQETTGCRKISILRHDNTITKPCLLEGSTTLVVENVIRLEFVARVPHFDTMKLGSQHAQKGLVKVVDLKPFFKDHIKMPLIVHNVTTMLSRNASGQYFDLIRNLPMHVETTNKRNETMITGLTPIFQMNTYISSVLSPVRLDIMTQFALVGHKLALIFQHIRSSDITNPQSLTIPPSAAHILKMYRCVRANVLFKNANSDEWFGNPKCMDRKLLEEMRSINQKYNAILEQ